MVLPPPKTESSLRKLVDSQFHVSFLVNETIGVKLHWVWITGLIVKHCPELHQQGRSGSRINRADQTFGRIEVPFGIE